MGAPGSAPHGRAVESLGLGFGDQVDGQQVALLEEAKPGDGDPGRTWKSKGVRMNRQQNTTDTLSKHFANLC